MVLMEVNPHESRDSAEGRVLAVNVSVPVVRVVFFKQT